jgi:hypothetical protein
MTTVQQPLQELADFVITNDQTAEHLLEQMEKFYLDDANLLRPPHHDAEQLVFHAYMANIAGQFAAARETLIGLTQRCKSCPAHADLARSMCADKLELANLKDLIAEAQRLAKFYQSLN